MIAWMDFRGPFGSDIYAQRIGANGMVQWATNGVAVSAEVNAQEFAELTEDGSGGAIIVWEDSRNSPSRDVYAQRISGSGSPQWTVGGVAICTAAGMQVAARIAGDGSGGAIVAWMDGRSGANFDIYAGHLDAAGKVD